MLARMFPFAVRTAQSCLADCGPPAEPDLAEHLREIRDRLLAAGHPPEVADRVAGDVGAATIRFGVHASILRVSGEVLLEAYETVRKLTEKESRNDHDQRQA